MKLYVLNRKVILAVTIVLIAFLVYQGVQYFKINKYGFRLIEEKTISEINSNVKIFKHKKTGARLIHIDNDDENKVFSINFRTPPTDNTGVAHIIEHSVFCGSRKYPLKDPFVELNKGSLNTYLNAATAPDYTMYPCASVNEKELRNLMDVYLDAVFYPNFYQNPEVFRQEGWHYELKDEKSILNYQGVVYNEMQGVYSTPSNYLLRNILNSLFPNTVYSKDSGGDPLAIPNLSSKEFLEYHQKYYHPSNSFIYLYGDLNLSQTLRYLNKEYLRNFSQKKIASKIPLEPTFTEKKYFIGSYPSNKGESTDNKTYISRNYVLGENQNQELTWAFQILNLVLDNNSSPLKEALNFADIGENISSFYEPSIQQPILGIVVENAKEYDQQRFERIVESSLTKMVDEGIEPELIKSAINQVEISLREESLNAGRGINYNMKVMSSWLYDHDPSLFLEYEETLEKIKSEIPNKYFENLIKTYLLENKHQSQVIVKPDPYLLDKNKIKVAERLTKITESLSEADVDEILNLNEKLKSWQVKPDEKETVAKIPKISLRDIRTPQKPEMLKKSIEETNVLHHPFETGELVYLDFYFDASKVPQEKISYLYLLAQLLGKVDTKGLSQEELKEKIKMHTGGIGCEVRAFTDYKDKNVFYPKFIISAKVLESNLPEVFKILSEIGTSNFKETKNLATEIKKVKLTSQNLALESGERLAIKRCLSYFNPGEAYNELGGLSFNHFITQTAEGLSTRENEIRANLQEVSKLIFNKQGLLISITCDKDKYKSVSDTLPDYLKSLNNKQTKANLFKFKMVKKNEGIISPVQVQHVIQGNNFKNLGYEYHGSMKVLENIIDTEYLWNRVRMQGGAYGARASFSSTGDFILFSYRDPNLSKTLEVFKELPKFIEGFKVTDNEINKYIIGAISDLDRPLSPYEQSRLSAMNHLVNCSYKDVQENRKQILDTNEKKIRELVPLLKKVLEDDYHCIVGNEKVIKDNQEYFGQIMNINL
ncbi:hypothetical protein SAMN00017405_1278 [Desulfonispora thiosulfatigenes DSM 11270]|uniref:Peptidase M16C associated domain-containing protein n=1 Tax=Desulfonispora thiosulfatigenes DSM 11270 TaxID=656914 RepID=A0A1W1V210_DESTI|nr:insulinase family protein [Desulfonispora thiosulfatigenes]SMB87330.1 hypothetical protein SAMN00017405_1278 [Desulfonispora thiosulfatigenes DSM 11270]